MSPTRLKLMAFGLCVLVGTALAAGATQAATAAKMKPVIGKPIAAPTAPVAGKRFTVSYKVTRSDTGAPLRTGTMICDPSVANKVLAHTESFKGGTARLSFIVPTSAKALKVRVTIRAAGSQATSITNYKVKGGYIPTLSVADASVTEGNTGTATLSFPVTLSAKSTDTVSVSYATADGTATQPADYAGATGSISFKPGETAKTIAVTVVNDTAYEPNETFTLTLTKPAAATIADGSATGTITNDDPAIRSGHYAGTTSQGYAVSFDVAADLKSVSNLTWTDDLVCTEVPVVLTDDRWNLPGSFPLAPDWGFSYSDSYSDSNGSITAAFNGKLTPPGSGSGTLRIDLALNMSFGVVHCSTGNVTWNAS